MNNQNYFTKDVILILLLLLAVQILTLISMGCIPPFERQYIVEAERLFYTNDKVYITAPPAYPALLFCFHALVRNWYVASQLVYILFSFLTSLLLYAWTVKTFNISTGKIVLLLMLFFPCLTVLNAGYSHIMVVGLFFFTAAIYSFWNLWNFYSWKYIVLFTLSSVGAIFMRPEVLIIVAALVLIWMCKIFFTNNEGKRLLSFIKLGTVVFSFFLFLWLHKSYVAERNSDPRTSVFSDAKYSYRTFTFAFCSNESFSTDDVFGEAKAQKYFGSAEENNYSIATAIRKNPKKYLSNFLFNLNQSLKQIAHPLVIPFFILLFAGIGIFNSDWKRYKEFHLFMAAIIGLIVFTYSLFHVQEKYLVFVSVPFLMWSACGISNIENKKIRIWSISVSVAALFFIYLSYLILFMNVGKR